LVKSLGASQSQSFRREEPVVHRTSGNAARFCDVIVSYEMAFFLSSRMRAQGNARSPTD
jgi:hypothetical protein